MRTNKEVRLFQEERQIAVQMFSHLLDHQTLISRHLLSTDLLPTSHDCGANTSALRCWRLK